jgi:hypothetical protein
MAATDYDHQATRNEIIQGALRKIGALHPGESIGGSEMVAAVQALNDMVKSWQSKNIFLWTVVEFDLTLATSDKDYAVPTDPPIILLEEAWYLDGTTLCPVEILSWREFLDIRTPSDTGVPTHCTFKRGQSPEVHVWPTPTATENNDTFRCRGVAKLKDWETAAGSGDFPAHWTLALQYGLAVELAPEYGLSDRRIVKLETRAAAEFITAKQFDRDGSEYETVRGAYPV